MMTSIVKLGTQIQNISMRSSKPIIKSDASKQLTKYSFECKFHDLMYFELGISCLDYIILIYPHNIVKSVYTHRKWRR